MADLGDAWAGNSVNCVSFRGSGLIATGESSVAAFYDADGQVALVETNEATGESQRAALPGRRMPFDPHVAISIGRDSDGRIHVAFGAHRSPLLLARSRAGDLASGFEAAEELTGRRASRITYPTFISVPGHAGLILVCRIGRSWRGAIHVWRLDPQGGWVSDEWPIISGRSRHWNAGPYLNTPAIGPNGEVALFITWRLEPQSTGAGDVANAGIDCIVSDDGLRSLHTAGGVPLTAPVRPVNSERIMAVPIGANLINQAGAAIRPDGVPMVVTYFDDDSGIPQYRLGWKSGGNWRFETISAFTTRFRLEGKATLNLPHARPQLLAGDDLSAHVVYRSREAGNRLMLTSLPGPDYDVARATSRILVDEDLGDYEPVVDLDRFRRTGDLAMYVQRCEQRHRDDRGEHRETAPARLMVWRRAALAAG